MADAIKGLFSSAPGLERVRVIGLIVMLAGVLLTVFCGKLAAKWPEEKRDGAKIVLKLASLVVCLAGFIIAII